MPLSYSQYGISCRETGHCGASPLPQGDVITVLSCIDFRFTTYLARSMEVLGHRYMYYDIATAGASFPLFYPQLATGNYLPTPPFGPPCACMQAAPTPAILDTLTQSILTNLSITKTLNPEQKKLYIVDHQNCGAFKYFSGAGDCEGKGCLDYPELPSEDVQSKTLELLIHQNSLTVARDYLVEAGFDTIVLGMLDLSGAFAILEDGKWKVVVQPERIDPTALFSYPAPENVVF